MTYRSLLVLLDDSAQCPARVQMAVRLASGSECHLVGLAPTGIIELPVGIGAGAAASLSEHAALAWDALRDQAEQAAQRFRDKCRVAGVKSFLGIVDEADKAASVVRYARCSDLVVLSQADPRSADRRQTRHFVEQVVLQSARPTLVVPHAGNFEHIGKDVLVAWDDSREAARALADALPLLRHANQVHLVAWNEPGSTDNETIRARLDAVHRWLMWHGVHSDTRIEILRGGIGDAIRACAVQIDADLVVMGAYGHARWAEQILGGATRSMLDSTTVPVLMSH